MLVRPKVAGMERHRCQPSHSGEKRHGLAMSCHLVLLKASGVGRMIEKNRNRPTDMTPRLLCQASGIFFIASPTLPTDPKISPKLGCAHRAVPLREERPEVAQPQKAVQAVPATTRAKPKPRSLAMARGSSGLSYSNT